MRPFLFNTCFFAVVKKCSANTMKPLRGYLHTCKWLPVWCMRKEDFLRLGAHWAFKGGEVFLESGAC